MIETSEFSGGYVLGFRSQQVDAIYAEASKLFKLYSTSPIFGVELSEETEIVAEMKAADEDLEIITTEDTAAQKARLRYEVGRKTKADGELPEVQFNEDIGLACEALPAGLNLEKLWKII